MGTKRRDRRLATRLGAAGKVGPVREIEYGFVQPTLEAIERALRQADGRMT